MRHSAGGGRRGADRRQAGRVLRPDEDNTIAIAQQFKEDTGIEIEYISLGGGDAVARVQAEMNNPQADFLVGGSVDLYGSLAEAGAFVEYDSPNNDDLDERFNDPNHLWQGWYMGVLSIINEERFQEELASQGLAEPTTWDDLLDPAYKDVFVWANPTTAGGAYIATACQIFRLGEDAAWEYLKALDQNVHHYYQGAGDVISPVATGEFIASIAWAHDSSRPSRRAILSSSSSRSRLPMRSAARPSSTAVPTPRTPRSSWTGC